MTTSSFSDAQGFLVVPIDVALDPHFAELVLLAKCVQMLHRVQQFLGEQEGGGARAIRVLIVAMGVDDC